MLDEASYDDLRDKWFMRYTFGEYWHKNQLWTHLHGFLPVCPYNTCHTPISELTV